MSCREALSARSLDRRKGWFARSLNSWVSSGVLKIWLPASFTSRHHVAGPFVDVKDDGGPILVFVELYDVPNLDGKVAQAMVIVGQAFSSSSSSLWSSSLLKSQRKPLEV